MLLNLSEDQEFFRETTDRFLTEQAPPDALRALRHDPVGFDPAYWRRGAELGWTSLLVSEEHGGGTISDAGLVDLSLVAYEFGRHAAPGPARRDQRGGGAAERARRGARRAGRPALGRGASPPGARRRSGPTGGSRPSRPRRDGTDLVLRGEARLVESAGQADHLLVTCRDEGGTSTQVLRARVGTPGVTVSPMQTVDLTRRFGVVTFDDVRVPADAVVGAGRRGPAPTSTASSSCSSSCSTPSRSAPCRPAST